ncbi:GPW/gp25 family protein [Candidatus Chloroploca sp. M-50]|uniref:GPW/gp25 family protein n=1 Tax=Candidatus Chloroploca mongolica TaxID=2528176 RepID=A0ABS4DA23_9CHLR|nr:GPW/gp25 family protein [Candidatus Chloroploca mongolica]MBP1466290.1 GPW/gp25 family protein [Candidatus Chloroploca mongolica]
MTAGSRYQAWRFVVPGMDVMDPSAGLQVNDQGGVAMVSGDASVRQAILLLLSTIPGERVMRPDYGCLLHRLVFSPNDETAAGLAIYYVRSALERWEPRIEIVHIDAQRHHLEPDRLLIILDYRVRATRQIEHLVVSIHLAGEDF